MDAQKKLERRLKFEKPRQTKAPGQVLSISRSSGVHKGGDDLRSFVVQERVLDYAEQCMKSGDTQNAEISLRKLREAIKATGRSDVFARKVQDLSVKTAIQKRDWILLRTILASILWQEHTDGQDMSSLEKSMNGMKLSEPYLDLYILLECFVYGKSHPLSLIYRVNGSRPDIMKLYRAMKSGNWIAFEKLAASVQGDSAQLIDVISQRMQCWKTSCEQVAYR